MRIDGLAVWINTIGYASADLLALARRLEAWGGEGGHSSVPRRKSSAIVK